MTRIFGSDSRLL